jgi:hypothetical protein
MLHKRLLRSAVEGGVLTRREWSSVNEPFALDHSHFTCRICKHRQRFTSSPPLPLTHAILTVPNMSSKGWFNLETAGGAIPETQFFEGDSAFKSLGLTRTQRLYGFVGWYVLQIDKGNPPRSGPRRGSMSWSPLSMTCYSACSTVTLLDWF